MVRKFIYWSSTGEPDFWTVDSRLQKLRAEDWLLGSLGVFWDFQMDSRHRLRVDQAFCWKACFAGSESNVVDAGNAATFWG